MEHLREIERQATDLETGSVGQISQETTEGELQFFFGTFQQVPPSTNPPLTIHYAPGCQSKE